MCAATVDWITFSGLFFIVLLSAILITFLIIEFSKTVSLLTKDKTIGKDTVEYLKELDEQLD